MIFSIYEIGRGSWQSSHIAMTLLSWARYKKSVKLILAKRCYHIKKFISSVLLIFLVIEISIHQETQAQGDSFFAITWSPDNSKIALAGDGVWIVDVASNQVTQLDTTFAEDVDWRSDGTQLATLHQDIPTTSWQIKIWDVASGSLIRTITDDLQYIEEVGELDWHPTQDLILVTGYGLRIIDTNTGNRITQIDVPTQNNISTYAVWSYDGRLIGATDDNQQATIWDYETGNLLHEVPVVRYGIAWSPTEYQVAINGTETGAIEIWDVSGTSAVKVTTTGIGGETFDWQSTVIAAVFSKTIRLLDLFTTQKIAEINLDQPIRVVSLDSTGTYLAYNTHDGCFHIIQPLASTFSDSSWQDRCGESK